MDYRKLCVEFFGTDDVEELRAIAEKLNIENPRNAGRRKKYTEEDAEHMRQMQSEGFSVAEIAEAYGSPRQVIARYLTSAMPEGCTLRMTYMHKQQPCSIIDVDFSGQKVYLQNKTDDLLRRAFGATESPTWQDFEAFVEDRCFQQGRGDMRQILRSLDLDCYEPLSILEKLHGRTAEDDMWIRFTYRNASEKRRP